jgi:hypothetical protein
MDESHYFTWTQSVQRETAQSHLWKKTKHGKLIYAVTIAVSWAQASPVIRVSTP